MRVLCNFKWPKVLVGFALISYGNLFSQTFDLHTFGGDSFWDKDFAQIEVMNETEVACLTRGDSLLTTFNGSEWTFYGRHTYDFVLSGSAPNELAIHPNGDFWINHSFQVDQFDGTTTTNYSSPPLEHEIIVDMAISTTGVLFFGNSSGNGLSIKDGDTWTHRGDFTGSLSAFNDCSIMHFLETDPYTNTVWIVESNKFHALKDGVITTYTYYGPDTDTPGIPSSAGSNISAMTVTADGNIWFSLNPNTDDPTQGGLLRFDGEVWQHINTSNSLIPSNKITAITAVGNNLVFSYPENIVIYDQEVYSNFNSSNSDFPGIISNIRELKNVGGVIYGATSSGLLEMNYSFSSITSSELPFIEVWFSQKDKTLNLQTESSFVNISIYSLQGKKINQVDFFEQKKLSFGSIPKGVYIVAISDPQIERTFVEKICIY